MPSKRKRSTAGPGAIIGRGIQIQSVGVHVSRQTNKPRGEPARFEGGPWLEVRGTADEAVRDVRDIVISVHTDEREEPGPTSPPSVGAIIQVRPKVQAVVGLPSLDFDRLWVLALTGHLRYSWMAFTEPHRGSARIVSVSFSNEIEE